VIQIKQPAKIKDEIYRLGLTTESFQLDLAKYLTNRKHPNTSKPIHIQTIVMNAIHEKRIIAL